jgi:hypothetical protein
LQLKSPRTQPDTEKQLLILGYMVKKMQSEDLKKSMHCILAEVISRLSNKTVVQPSSGLLVLKDCPA